MRPVVWLVCALTLGSIACNRRCDEGFCYLPGSWRVVRALQGPAAQGYGAAVAFDVQGRVVVGAPWQGSGALFVDETQVRSGQPMGLLGAGLSGGTGLVGVPGEGKLLGFDGGLLQGDVVGLGTSPVWHRGAPAAIARGQVWSAADDGFVVGERLWALASVNLGDGPRLIAAVATGGLIWREGRTVESWPARSIVGCDLDADGDHELLLGDPTTGEVRVYEVDSIGSLRLDRPSVVHRLGAGAGQALVCVHGGVLVGAPDHVDGSRVIWIAEPASAGVAVWTHVGGVDLGHALAVGAGAVAVGDPGEGRVLLLEPRRRGTGAP